MLYNAYKYKLYIFVGDLFPSVVYHTRLTYGQTETVQYYK